MVQLPRVSARNAPFPLAPGPDGASSLYLFCPGAKVFALVTPGGFFSWPGAESELPFPPLFADGGGFCPHDGGELLAGDDEFVPDDAVLVPDDDPVLLALALAELRLPFPPASLIPFAALLKTSVVALLRAPIATTRLATSKSKRTAYSGAETPASSLPRCRNMLAPKPPITRYPRVVVPRIEEATLGYAVSRLISVPVELLTVTYNHSATTAIALKISRDKSIPRDAGFVKKAPTRMARPVRMGNDALTISTRHFQR